MSCISGSDQVLRENFFALKYVPNGIENKHNIKLDIKGDLTDESNPR